MIRIIQAGEKWVFGTSIVDNVHFRRGNLDFVRKVIWIDLRHKLHLVIISWVDHCVIKVKPRIKKY